jgi:HPr kinase/phosphorylase
VENGSINHHCTCVKINSVGVMIEGKSGAGKTSLGLGILNAARIRGADFAMVCDDQALIDIQKNNELWVKAPMSIAGKVELHGAGIAEVKTIAHCRIQLVCELINQADIIRHPGPLNCTRFGIRLDYIQAPWQHEAQSIRILLQKLSLSL